MADAVDPARSLLLDAFERVHQQVPKVVEGLEPDALAFRPQGGGNPIGWLVWHLSRVQDDHVAELADVGQVWTTGGWHERFELSLPPADTGYGHSDEQVDEVGGGVFAQLLAGYHEAVHALTTTYLGRVDADELQRVVDDRWDPPVTAGVRLVSVIGDTNAHVAQAQYVRGLWERLR